MRKTPSIPPAGGSRPPPLPAAGASPSPDADADALRAPGGGLARPAEVVRAGTYDLLLELASGGMATVYLARAREPSAEASPLVAIKRPHRHLAKDKMFLSMLLDEARLASAIEHPNVVKVRELGFEQAEPFIVLDYVEGASLSELRKELAAAERAVDTRVAVRIVLDALAGLHAAHDLTDDSGRSLGIIHRDVSPHNVLIGCDGRVRLTDFGIAKAEDRMQDTRTHEVKGKLAYLAPERIDKRRRCTKQSDIFSMAVVLWECLAGRRLFRGEEALDTLHEVMEAPIPRLRQLGADIPLALDEAVARGLSRDLSVRYATAADFAHAIERGAGEANVGTAADVARVMAAVFGAILRHRHQEIREVVGAAAADELLKATGITPRTPPPPNMPLSTPALYAAVAPPAPSERYAFGNVRDIAPSRRFMGRSWKTLTAIVVGGVVGAAAVLAIFSAVYTSHGAAPAASSAPPSAAPASPSHAPAADPRETMGASWYGTRDEPLTGKSVVAGDGPPGGKPAVASDEASDIPPPSPSAPDAGKSRAHRDSDVGTTRNGFTKLK